MSDLTDALERIRVFWEMNNPFVASLLEPGLSTQEINAKVEALSFCLPQEVYELYQWRNGISMNRAREYLQHIPSWCTFIEHFDFLPLEQAVDECRYLQEVKQEWIGNDPESYADNCTVVGYAAQALGKLGDTRAIEPLKRLIASLQVNDPTESLNEIDSEFRSDVMMGSIIHTIQFYLQVLDTLFSSFPTDAAWEEHFALDEAKLALTLLEGNIHS